MKKLLILISSMSYGGAETQTLELANGLVHLEYTVDMVVLNDKQELTDMARPEICFHIMGKKKYLDFIVVKKIAILVASIKPDIIMCVDLYPLLYLKAALGKKIKSYHTAVVYHSTLPLNFKDYIKRTCLVPLTNSATKQIFVSRKQMKYWTTRWKINQANSVVIYNGIHIDKYGSFLQNEEDMTSHKDKLGFTKNDIVVGTCSNFRPEKRQQDLIRACAGLKRKGYPVKVLLIGDGQMRHSIEGLIHNLGLESDVVITGFKADVRPYLAAIDVFVLTSSTETLSIAAIESLAMKKAAILSDTGGASEIVVDGISGFIYPVKDVDKLIEKLEIIFADSGWKQMGEAGYRHAVLKFHKGQMIHAYNRLFTEMSAEKPATS